MGLEVVEEEGGLCQIGWRFFGSSAAFRALEREIPLLEGRQRGTEEVGFPLALPSQQQDHGCLLQPGANRGLRGTSRGATDREPRDTRTEAQVTGQNTAPGD